MIKKRKILDHSYENLEHSYEEVRRPVKGDKGNKGMN